jgi:hypothetical protein
MLSHDKGQYKTDMGERYTSPKQLCICFVDEISFSFNEQLPRKCVISSTIDVEKRPKNIFFYILACYCQFCTNLGAIPIELYNSSVPFPHVQVLKTKGQPACAGRWFSTAVPSTVCRVAEMPVGACGRPRAEESDAVGLAVVRREPRERGGGGA